MSFISFFKERDKKVNLLNDLKATILDESHDHHKLLEKNGVESTDEILKIFVSQGYQAYHSGDLNTFELFIKSLFKIYEAPNNFENRQILDEIKNFGLMSAHHHNHKPYYIILENYKEHLFMTAKTETFKQHLNILRNFALISLANNYIEGVLGVVHVYKVLNRHFEENDIIVCQTYLKNAIINLIYSAEKYEKDDLKGQILPEINDILGYEEKEASPVEIIKESLNPNIQANSNETEKPQDLEV